MRCKAFKIVENEKNYETIVPYYIAQIYYIQGKKDEAIAYADKKTKGKVEVIMMLK